MGRNISVMVGGGQRPERGTDNRHRFAIDWLGHKGGVVERGAGGWWGVGDSTSESSSLVVGVGRSAEMRVGAQYTLTTQV